MFAIVIINDEKKIIYNIYMHPGILKKVLTH